MRTQELANRLEIQLVDPQFLISRDGAVKLIDPDHWMYIDSEGRHWGYEGHYPIKAKGWPDREQLNNNFVEKVAAELDRLEALSAAAVL